MGRIVDDKLRPLGLRTRETETPEMDTDDLGHFFRVGAGDW